MSVVIPAHNEAASITSCVQSLAAAERPATPCDIIVIADNCIDNTAARARAADATVWERNDSTNRGKGFALAFAFERLMSETESDAVVIVDADTEVAGNFLTTCEAAFSSGAEAVQAAYHVKNADDSTRTRLMNVAFLAFNVLRPRGRARWGLSAGILGNGWGMSRACLQDVPYNAHSVVEDLEHHIELVRAGYRVEFLHDTHVRAEMPDDEQAADTQRARWEGGRFRMIREHVPQLLAQAMDGNPRAAEPAFELMLLPLAYHVAGLGAALVIPFPPTQLYALGGLSIVGAHIAAGLAVGGGTWADVKALASAPGYMLWKARVLPNILSSSVKDQTWIRTIRKAEGP